MKPRGCDDAAVSARARRRRRCQLAPGRTLVAGSITAIEHTAPRRLARDSNNHRQPRERDPVTDARLHSLAAERGSSDGVGLRRRAEQRTCALEGADRRTAPASPRGHQHRTARQGLRRNDLLPRGCRASTTTRSIARTRHLQHRRCARGTQVEPGEPCMRQTEACGISGPAPRRRYFAATVKWSLAPDSFPAQQQPSTCAAGSASPGGTGPYPSPRTRCVSGGLFPVRPEGDARPRRRSQSSADAARGDDPAGERGHLLLAAARLGGAERGSRGSSIRSSGGRGTVRC